MCWRPMTVARDHGRHTDGMPSESKAEKSRTREGPGPVAWERGTRSPANGVLRGALAGALATIPMTAVIYLLDRQKPHQERGELPPRQITEELAERSGAEQQVGEVGLDLATTVNHFGFGAATGSLFGSVADRSPLSPTLSGITFGLAVWASSYAGVLPKLGLQPEPERRPSWRNVSMIAGHIVWGAALGWTERQLRDGLGGASLDRNRRFTSGREPGPAEVHW